MRNITRVALSFVLAALATQAQGNSIRLLTGSTTTVVANCDAIPCGRPRLNDLGEVVWHERFEPIDDRQYGIFSSTRGLIASGMNIAYPDINNLGEIIWRYSFPGPTEIRSNIRGTILTGSDVDSNDTHRINNLGEVIVARTAGTQRLWSSTRGSLLTVGTLVRTNVNDLGEIVYRASHGETRSIQSTSQGALIDGYTWVDNPDVNNLGEVVWQQIPSSSSFDPHQIWSSVRGFIGQGITPSINDSGEIVWADWDGNDYEIYSSVRGQITFNDAHDDSPQINNAGDIVWLSAAPSTVPEPSSSILLLTALAAVLVGHHRR